MKSALLLAFLGLTGRTLADPTWPSEIDELEEIMFQLESFRARKFADTVSPCDNEASGPGRLNAAEWLRTAFHDMSTASVYFKTGGLDASLQYELTNSENKGPGLTTTIEFMAPYLSRKSSLADLLAMGVYMSVRSCGGPAVPIRAGRVDATAKGSTGVPQPENSVLSFQQQFDRMGFTNEEMIQVTACGHTLGGVHSEEFADIVPAGTGTDGQIGLDTSAAVFDNKIVTEYLDGKTKNPLVVGPAVKIGKHSDFKVFNSDGNATMEALTDAQKFKDVCKVVLQKMIDVVPPGVTLTDPIQPYQVKPVNLQLTLADGGKTLKFTGYTRVKTTDLGKDAIKNVVITYKNRKGGSSCGSDGCSITTTVQGASQGFDDTFSFFPIEADIPASSGISSFTVTVNYSDGTKDDYDNNGKEYPLQDAILLQLPQSCLLGSSGDTIITAAVHNDRVSDGASAFVSYKTTQTKSPSPKLENKTIILEKGDCVGDYTFFSTEWTIPGDLPYESFIDVSTGDDVDSFKSAVDFGGTCRDFTNPAKCSGESDPGTSTTSDATSKTSTSETITTTRKTSTSKQGESSTVTSTSGDKVPTSTTGSSASPTVSLHHRDAVGGYVLVSCWTDGQGGRTLSGASYAEDDMTLESCVEHCKGFAYWGTEYGHECWCGNSLSKDSKKAPLEDCNMVCEGDETQYCGAGDRLELYSTTASMTSSPPAPTPTHVQSVGSYTLVGCWTERSGGRALSQHTTSDPDMTNEKCASDCKNYRYFATEYSDECYCGSHVAKDTESAPLEDCSMTCAGDDLSYCGGRSRLELYMNPDIPGGDPEQPLAAGDFSWYGCQTDDTTVQGGRALRAKVTSSDEDMTNELCAETCAGYKYFGTEYGKECYCGDELDEKSEGADAGECDMLCSGSMLEYCGSGNRLSVYERKAEEIVS